MRHSKSTLEKNTYQNQIKNQPTLLLMNARLSKNSSLWEFINLQTRRIHQQYPQESLLLQGPIFPMDQPAQEAKSTRKNNIKNLPIQSSNSKTKASEFFFES